MLEARFEGEAKNITTKVISRRRDFRQGRQKCRSSFKTNSSNHASLIWMLILVNTFSTHTDLQKPLTGGKPGGGGASVVHVYKTRLSDITVMSWLRSLLIFYSSCGLLYSSTFELEKPLFPFVNLSKPSQKPPNSHKFLCGMT